MHSRSNWNLEVLVFYEGGGGGDLSTLRETSRSKGENQEQSQPTYDVYTRIQTWAR